MSDLYYLGNSRSPEQTAEMIRLEAAGVCIFCPDSLSRSGAKEILYQNQLWTITTNDYPYQGTKHHLLLVPSEHVSDITDLSEEAQDAFWGCLRWVKLRYGLTYYGLGVRSGDFRFTGATIYHLHFHLIVGDPEQATASPVKLKLSSAPPMEQ